MTSPLTEVSVDRHTVSDQLSCSAGDVKLLFSTFTMRYDTFLVLISNVFPACRWWWLRVSLIMKKPPDVGFTKKTNRYLILKWLKNPKIIFNYAVGSRVEIKRIQYVQLHPLYVSNCTYVFCFLHCSPAKVISSYCLLTLPLFSVPAG